MGVRSFSMQAGDISSLEHRALPLASLGFGHAGAVDKSHALWQSLYMEAGPSEEAIRAFCCSVYSIVTDSRDE